MKKKMKDQEAVKGRLRLLTIWPLAVLPFALVALLIIIMMDWGAGLVALVFTCLYVAFCVWWMLYWQPRLNRRIADVAAGYEQMQSRQTEESPVPHALLDTKGNFLWMNRAFRKVTGDNESFQHNISAIFPGVTEELPEAGQETKNYLDYADRTYKVILRGLPEDNGVISVYLTDETDYRAAINRMQEQQVAIGMVCVDNYEEVMNSTEGVRRALLAALIERRIHKYFGTYDSVVRQTEKDKFFLLLREKELPRLEEDNFSLLEEVKGLNIGNELPVTLSISVGCGGESLAKNAEYAQKSMDLALGRGGDQAVIRTGEQIRYFGGKSQRQEKNTRVKARVKALALRELLATKDKVLIMGHSMPDCDAIGAAVGIYRAAKTLGKKTSIILDTVTSSVRPVLDLFDVNEYPDDMFIKHDAALSMVDDNTCVVVVDTNRPSYTECPELLEKATTVVLFDHHRQGGDTIERATLSYIEPYASSTCEMVAEILQYFSDDLKLRTVEAEAMYAGIVIDTNNFMNKTGVRTFEAAAYLRRKGADVTAVRKLFRERMEDYQVKAETLRTAEIFRDSFAIAICNGEGIENPTILGAQAANDLLDIIGVKASIVFTSYGGKIFVSARSIDEVNVQLIMERLGGGGHLTAAGTQLTGCTVEEAKELVKQTIIQMIEEGAI